MICTDCQHRDVCDFAGKDSPILTYCCDREGGSWWFDRLRLERMTADRDALRAELEGARAANRVLDSAAKDAQSWAYQLQQCRAELDRTKGEMERVRSAATLLLSEADDVMDRYESRCPIQAGELQRAIDQMRSALERKADA